MRRSLSKILLVAVAVACSPAAHSPAPAGSVAPRTAAGDSAERTVRAFVAAYNAHDIPAILSLADSSIAWLSVAGDSIAVETRGHAQLEASLSAYFRRLPSTRSTLESVSATGPWVTVRERAHWQGRDGARSQAAVAVYEVRAGRVRRVWYFPAVSGTATTTPATSSGFADAHVHLSYGGREELDSLLAHGITVVRDCGGDLAEMTRWRRDIASGQQRGPRLYISGPVLDGPKEGARHRLTVSTASEAERAVDSLAAAGVDFLKTHNAIPPEAFFAVLRRAKAHGLRVAAHLPRGVPAWVAADSGVGSIEHAAESMLASPINAGYASDVAGAIRWWHSPAGDSAIRRLAARRVTIVPTLVRYEASIASSATPELRAGREALLPELLDLVRRLHHAGVPILVGSDLVGLPDPRDAATGPARERILLARAGLSPDAIAIAGSAAALERWFASAPR